MRHLITLLLLITIPSFLSAQKMEKVNIEELELTQHHTDTITDAYYMHAECKIKYEYRTELYLKMKYAYRIKILKDEGERMGEIEIPLYNDSKDKETLKSLKATTYNIENGKVVKTKMDKKSVFKEKTTENWTTHKFAIPNIKAGSIIDLEYEIRSPYLTSVPKWYFQRDVPVEFSKMTLEVPRNFMLNPVATGSVPLENIKSDYTTKDFEYSVNEYFADSIPALRDDPFVLNINDYRSGLKYEIAEVRWNNGERKRFSSTWNDVVKSLYSNSYKKEFKRKFDLPIELEESLAGSEEMEKLEKIYYYVQNNFEWNGNYGIYGNDFHKELFVNNAGSVGQINTLLINLLIKNGFEAVPILTKSRNRGLLNTNFPSITELNYLFAKVRLGDKIYYLDATEKHLSIGALPDRAVNIFVLEADINNPITYQLENPNSYNETIFCNYTIDDSNQSLNGTGQIKQSGFAAFRRRAKFLKKQSSVEKNNTSEKSEKEEANFSSAKEEEQDSIVYNEILNLENPSEELKAKVELKLVSPFKQIADEIYIDADLGLGIRQELFEEKERSYPIFYDFDISTNHIHIIEVPSEYQVSELPESTRMKTFNGIGSFNYLISQTGNQIKVNYSFKLKEPIILPEYYEEFKEFIRLIKEKHKEKIVLTKL